MISNLNLFLSVVSSHNTGQQDFCQKSHNLFLHTFVVVSESEVQLTPSRHGLKIFNLRSEKITKISKYFDRIWLWSSTTCVDFRTTLTVYLFLIKKLLELCIVKLGKSGINSFWVNLENQISIILWWKSDFPS